MIVSLSCYLLFIASSLLCVALPGYRHLTPQGQGLFFLLALAASIAGFKLWKYSDLVIDFFIDRSDWGGFYY
jgi:hypothetical protein